MNSDFNFESWKKKKIERGEWLPREEYIKKQKKEKRKRKRNSRDYEDLEDKNLKTHNLLFEDFVKNCSPIEDIIEDIKDTEDNIIDIKRELILDTETTGLSKEDKIVELSILELIDGIKTGRCKHYFFNPQIKMSKRAVEIHRITNEKVSDAPLFSEKAEEIIKFIGSGTVIAHNAKFDKRMLNNELIRSGWEPYPEKRFIDTLEISRFLFPSLPNSQDALCFRFNIDNHNRVTTGIHSAYEDTIQLYFIYTKLTELLKNKKMSPYDFKINHTINTE